MRLKDRVIFSLEESRSYNPKTSELYRYEISDEYNAVPCNINPISTKRLLLEFGDLSKKISIIRIKGRHDDAVSHAYVNNVKYKIIRSVLHRHDTVFYVERVGNNEN